MRTQQESILLPTRERALIQNSTTLAPWSWTSNLLNCEKYSFVVKPPNLWHLGTATQTKTYGQLIFDEGGQDYSMRKGQSFQQTVLGKLDVHLRNNQVGPFPWTIYKNKLKIKERFKLDCWNYETRKRGEHRGKSSWHWIWQWFHGYHTKSTNHKIKNR